MAHDGIVRARVWYLGFYRFFSLLALPAPMVVLSHVAALAPMELMALAVPVALAVLLAPAVLLVPVALFLLFLLFSTV